MIGELLTDSKGMFNHIDNGQLVKKILESNMNIVVAKYINSFLWEIIMEMVINDQIFEWVNIKTENSRDPQSL